MQDRGAELLGTRLGPYRLDDVLATGGMGVVYRAEHTDLGIDRAVKVIRPEFARDENYRARFLREAKTAAVIGEKHPNAIPIFDFAQEDGRLYLAMKLVDGTDLAQRLRAAPLDPEQALGIIEQAAGALDYAHQLGLVHRDVKPANLLIEPTDRGEAVYVVDFGLTRRIDADGASRSLTMSGSMVGTLDYMAPEQVTGSPPVSARTDVYALTCVVFNALSGEVPYPGLSTEQTMFAHVHRDPPTFEDPALQATYGPIIAKGMAKDPQDRFASAGELAAAMRDARPAAGQAPARPSATVPPPPAEPPRVSAVPPPPAGPPPAPAPASPPQVAPATALVSAAPAWSPTPQAAPAPGARVTITPDDPAGPPVWAAQPATNDGPNEALVVIGYVAAVLSPLIGLVLGVIVLPKSKGQPVDHGKRIILVSGIAFAFWFVLFMLAALASA